MSITKEQMKALKTKYSGQAVPQWEIDALGVAPSPEAAEEAPKRRGRTPKAENPNEPETE